MKCEAFRYRDEWLPNFYPSRRIAEDAYLRLSRTGRTQILKEAEDRQLTEVFMDSKLFDRLEASGHIVTETNSARVMSDLKRWHKRTFGGPYLHIVALTRRCNLNCTYCHMNPVPVSAGNHEHDMTRDTIEAVIDFAFSSPSEDITFVFQGGEPFLHFEGLRFFVEAARERNLHFGKKLAFSLTTNLLPVRDMHLDYCAAEGINVSYTLNGPEAVHNLYRVSRTERGSYKAVIRRINQFQEKYRSTLSPYPLCVLDGDTAEHMRSIIDHFVECGFDGIAIIKMKRLGNARQSPISYDTDTFISCYIDALEYIYALNSGLENKSFSERMVRVVLAKILSDEDVGYVDWKNPCGDIGGAITYDVDGEILPSDEARSLRDEFGLGNVREWKYEEFVKSRAPFRTMNLSLRDRDSECRECAFNPYCGVLPVLDYALRGDPVPVPYESEECKLTLALLDWVFEKLIVDPVPLIRMVPELPRILASVDWGETDKHCNSYFGSEDKNSVARTGLIE